MIKEKTGEVPGSVVIDKRRNPEKPGEMGEIQKKTLTNPPHYTPRIVGESCNWFIQGEDSLPK